MNNKLVILVLIFEILPTFIMIRLFHPNLNLVSIVALLGLVGIIQLGVYRMVKAS